MIGNLHHYLFFIAQFIILKQGAVIRSFAGSRYSIGPGTTATNFSIYWTDPAATCIPT